MSWLWEVGLCWYGFCELKLVVKRSYALRWKSEVRGKIGAAKVLIEMMKGSRNKIKYDFELDCLWLSDVLYTGSAFSTTSASCRHARRGRRSDRRLLRMDQSTPGKLVTARLVGKIEEEQTEDGEKFATTD